MNVGRVVKGEAAHSEQVVPASETEASLHSTTTTQSEIAPTPQPESSLASVVGASANAPIRGGLRQPDRGIGASLRSRSTRSTEPNPPSRPRRMSEKEILRSLNLHLNHSISPEAEAFFHQAFADYAKRLEGVEQQNAGSKLSFARMALQEIPKELWKEFDRSPPAPEATPLEIHTSIAELLEKIPPDHPQRDVLEAISFVARLEAQGIVVETGSYQKDEAAGSDETSREAIEDKISRIHARYRRAAEKATAYQQDAKRELDEQNQNQKRDSIRSARTENQKRRTLASFLTDHNLKLRSLLRQLLQGKKPGGPPPDQSSS